MAKTSVLFATTMVSASSQCHRLELIRYTKNRPEMVCFYLAPREDLPKSARKRLKPISSVKQLKHKCSQNIYAYRYKSFGYKTTSRPVKGSLVVLVQQKTVCLNLLTVCVIGYQAVQMLIILCSLERRPEPSSFSSTSSDTLMLSLSLEAI